jgi:hypothetical protein
VCLYRVDEDVSGLTFEEWDPSADTDTSQSPVAMMVNSSEILADTTSTRDGDAWIPAYARHGPQTDSRYGYQEVGKID